LRPVAPSVWCEPRLRAGTRVPAGSVARGARACRISARAAQAREKAPARGHEALASRLQKHRHGAVVYQLDRHPRAEHAALGAGPRAEALVQRPGLLGGRGGEEAGPVAAARLAIQGELAHAQDLALAERLVHAPLGIIEHAQRPHPHRAIAAEEVRVILLRGAGRAFCAGFDFGGGFHHWDAQLTTDGEWDSGKDFIAATSQALGAVPKFMSLWRSPKPVIAQVHGWCV